MAWLSSWNSRPTICCNNCQICRHGSLAVCKAGLAAIIAALCVESDTHVCRFEVPAIGKQVAGSRIAGHNPDVLCESGQHAKSAPANSGGVILDGFTTTQPTIEK